MLESHQIYSGYYKLVLVTGTSGKRQAMELNRQGNYGLAEELVRQQLSHFHRYCAEA